MRRLTYLVAVLALVATACQSVNQAAIDAEAYAPDTLNDPVLPVGPGGSVTIEAGDLFFVFEGQRTVSGGEITIEVPEGAIEVTLQNIGAAPHTFTVDEAVGDTTEVFANGGETATGTLQLFAGTYTFYCSIPGHRQAGMFGTLVVTPAAG